MSAQTPQCLLAFYTIGLALGDEPTLSANSAEDATLDDLLAETLQQLILAFIGSQNYACHFSHPLPCLQIVQQNTERPLFYRSGHFLSMGFLKDVSIFRQFCGCGRKCSLRTERCGKPRISAADHQSDLLPYFFKMSTGNIGAV